MKKRKFGSQGIPKLVYFIGIQLIGMIIICSPATAQLGKYNSTYDNIPASERHLFIIPKVEPYSLDYMGAPFIPWSPNRPTTKDNYCNGFPVKDFDPANLTKGRGTVLILNKHGEPLYIKNANWILPDEEEPWDRFFTKGMAEMLLVRNQKMFYHFGYSVSEAYAFGWNIYSTSDGSMEFGLVGGQNAIYPLERLPYSSNSDSFEFADMMFDGDSCVYSGQMEDGKPNGFGTIMNKEGRLVEYGFWEKGQMVPANEVLQALYQKHGLKTELVKSKYYGYPSKKRTVTGFFYLSKEKIPVGWYAAICPDEDVMAGFAGYHPDEQYPEFGPLESEDEVYGVTIGKRDEYNSWRPETTKFKARGNSFSKYYDQKVLISHHSPLLPGSYALIPGLMINYTPKHIIDEQRKIEKLKEEQKALFEAQMKELYENSKYKPGEIVKSPDGQLYYIDKINFNTKCYEMYPFPFRSSEGDLARAMAENRHQYPGKLYCRYHMSSVMNEMVSVCDESDFSLSSEIICTRCSGHGLVNANQNTVIESIEEKRKYEYRSGDLYMITYKVPVYYSRKTTIGVTCPICRGAGHTSR